MRNCRIMIHFYIALLIGISIIIYMLEINKQFHVLKVDLPWVLSDFLITISWQDLPGMMKSLKLSYKSRK